MNFSSPQTADSIATVKTPVTRFLKVKQHTLCVDHYNHQGDDSPKCPVILLHGLGASRFSWRYLAPALALDRDVYVPDLLGFGDSSKPRNVPYDVFFQADLMFALLDELGLKQAVVAGNSMGGGVALAMALDRMRRQHIKALILISTIAYAQQMPFYLNLLRKPFLGERLLELLPVQTLVRKVLEFSYFNPGKIGDAAVAAYAQPLKTKAGRQALVVATKHLKPDNLDEIIAQYKTINIPALLLWGENDHVVPVENGQRLAQAMPNAEFSTIPQCGHLAQEECPDAIRTQIKAFLTKLGL